MRDAVQPCSEPIMPRGIVWQFVAFIVAIQDEAAAGNIEVYGPFALKHRN
jgi:hypothetical protein